MNINNNILLKSVMVGVLINLFFPHILKKYITYDEISPPTPVDALPIKNQIMHMIYHHNLVPLSSSLIIATIIILSVYIAQIA